MQTLGTKRRRDEVRARKYGYYESQRDSKRRRHVHKCTGLACTGQVPSPASPAPDSPDDDPDSDSDSDVLMEYGETHGDVAAVAPEPPPFVPAGGDSCIPPPERAPLRPIVAAKASNRPPEPPQQHAAVADEEEEDKAVVTELTNPAVANELNTFMTQVLMADRKYVGIPAYLVFSFLYRKRVAIWFHGRRRDSEMLVTRECWPSPSCYICVCLLSLSLSLSLSLPPFLSLYLSISLSTYLSICIYIVIHMYI